MTWTSEVVRHTWVSAQIERNDRLRGDLSTRRFWRIHLAGGASPATAILVDLGDEDFPGYVRALNMVVQPIAEPPWLTLHRFLTGLGVPVPAMYAHDGERRAILIEDVGETSLVDAARHKPSATADLFRLAVELLLLFHVDGTRSLPAELLPAKIRYEERLFRWELKEFLDLGCAALGSGVDPEALMPELDALAGELGHLPRVFSHRDFHGQNLFVQHDAGTERLRVIDFQDALMAPAAQDLAVLLTTRDMSTLISPVLEQRLLDFYFASVTRRAAPNLTAEEFFRTYRLCVLQHAIKMMGRFLMFERSGKRGYAAFVPYTVEQSRRILGDPVGRDFPQLRQAFDVASTLVRP
jgi:aminoglycoside/choline kinase family phosphotransferase